VTEQQIVNAIINDGAKNIKDIIRLTGAMKNPNCVINNPKGKCCGSDIQAVIDMMLRSKKY